MLILSFFIVRLVGLMGVLVNARGYGGDQPKLRGKSLMLGAVEPLL